MTKSMTLAFGMASALAMSDGLPEARAEGPAPDLRGNCVDGGLPFPVGMHLCGSEHTVLICLRPEQSYGVEGIYTYRGRDKAGLRFDKAHWVETTSARCGRHDKGKTYRSSDPKH
jgi:hypothetical protein